MPVVDVRDSTVARQYLVQGLWLQRICAVDEQSATNALNWATELASSHEPIPPLGLVADIGNLVRGRQGEAAHDSNDHRRDFPAELFRSYEDYVLGKFYADATFERGSTAICRYAGRDADRGIAWLIAQFRERAGFGGIRCSPSVPRTLAHEPVEDILAEGSQSITSEGFMPWIEEHYREMVSGVRMLGEILAPEDVFELEHGTALFEFGQRLALRQVLAASVKLQAAAPHRPPLSLGRDRNVKTNLREEDRYPVGGFSSLSTRGSIESLLHSQLAYMEPKEAAGGEPDLFDIKFLRNELLYYSRDDNDFLRRRRAFVFALYPDLIRCRVKHANLPWQRIILILGLMVTVIEQLIEWLSDGSLHFEVVFLNRGRDQPLADEQELVMMLLREQIANGTVSVREATAPQLRSSLEERSRSCLTHCVMISCQDRNPEIGNVVISRLITDDGAPALCWEEEMVLADSASLAAWQQMTERLLSLLV